MAPHLLDTEKTAHSRPTFLNLDLTVDVGCESGYCSTQTSTDFEYAPFDWDAVNDKLEALQEFEVTLDTVEPFQYTLTDCEFTMKIHADFDEDSSYTEIFDSIEAVLVVGPMANYYPVTQRSGPDSSTLVCSFRPLESGHYICDVKIGSQLCMDPAPLIMQITRRFNSEDIRPICTMDIELPEIPKNEDKMELRNPWGLCSNKKTEQLFVADRQKHEILVFSPEGDLDFRFGEFGQEPGQFFRPTAVAYDAVHDRILVTDKDNHRIQVFTPQGQYIKHFGKKGSYSSQFYYPWGIAVSRDGELIAVADSRNHRIQLFDSEFNFIRRYSAIDKGQCYKQSFDYPRGICFDHKGENIFVTDFNLHCLFKLDIEFTNCKPIVKQGGILFRPQGVSLDNSGNILLCDSRHNSIKVISTDGTIISDIQSLGKGSLDLPLDVTCMKSGHLAVLDMNGRVRII